MAIGGNTALDPSRTQRSTVWEGSLAFGDGSSSPFVGQIAKAMLVSSSNITAETHGRVVTQSRR